MLISLSKQGTSEYCIDVVKIGQVFPIENSDFLAYTKVFNDIIVVRKDQVHEGDLMFYASNECQLSKEFLSVNNMFRHGELNTDPNQTGFFEDTGRVRAIKLRGFRSSGFLFGLPEMQKFYPEFTKEEMKQIVNVDFDTVGEKLLVKAYIPCTKTPHANNQIKQNTADKKYDRLVAGEFQFHYDTGMLQKEIFKIKPDDKVTITVKLHGTSAIFANVPVKVYSKNPIIRFINLFRKKPIYKIANGNLCASRRVIKNRYINKHLTKGFYSQDIWEIYNNWLKDYIPAGMTIYGEICGFLPDGSPIQGAYDYGNRPKHSFLMIYRITTDEQNGKKEWEISEVKKFTLNLMKLVPENENLSIHPIDILAEDSLRNLYPNIPVSGHWNEEIIDALRKDVRLGFEKMEPLCRNKVPREGIVVRKIGDVIPEAWKLKAIAFLNKEAKEIDKGNTNMEMNQ